MCDCITNALLLLFPSLIATNSKASSISNLNYRGAILIDETQEYIFNVYPRSASGLHIHREIGLQFKLIWNQTAWLYDPIQSENVMYHLILFEQTKN